jgi:hypothetical protein
VPSKLKIFTFPSPWHSVCPSLPKLALKERNASGLSGSLPKHFADNYPSPAHNSSRMPFKTQAEAPEPAPARTGKPAPNPQNRGWGGQKPPHPLCFLISANNPRRIISLQRRPPSNLIKMENLLPGTGRGEERGGTNWLPTTDNWPLPL